MALNRAGLLLSGGVIYTAFASPCDEGGNPYKTDPLKPIPHGWVFAYDTKRGTLYSLPTTVKASNAGVWQSGNGLAADEQGNVYAITGNNGHPDNITQPNLTEYGESILKIRLQQNALRVVDHFTAGNWYRLDTGQRGPATPSINLVTPDGSITKLTHLDNGSEKPNTVAADSDLGSGGPVLLPNGNLIGGGKQGVLYRLNTRNMQRAKQGFQAFYNSWSYWIDVCEYDTDQQYGPNIHGGLIVWHPEQSNYSLVYGMPEKDYLKAFRVSDSGPMAWLVPYCRPCNKRHRRQRCQCSQWMVYSENRTGSQSGKFFDRETLGTRQCLSEVHRTCGVLFIG